MSNESRRLDADAAGPNSDRLEGTERLDAEVRMRRALGLDAQPRLPSARPAGQPVGAHRASRVAEPRTNRVAEAENALAAERTARGHAEAQLRAVEQSLREVTTRLGHAELARDEALAALASERSAREAAEAQLLTVDAAPAAAPAAEEAPRKRRGRPPGSSSLKSAGSKPPQPRHDGGDAPVEWWVPGWKARFGSTGRA